MLKNCKTPKFNKKKNSQLFFDLINLHIVRFKINNLETTKDILGLPVSTHPIHIRFPGPPL